MSGEPSGALTVRSESLKGPSASESGDSENTLGFFSTGSRVSLVTVHVGIIRFFLLCFFPSVLGGVFVAEVEGLVVAVSGVEPPPLEALTSSLPQLGRVAVEDGGRGESCGPDLGGLATAGRPFARRFRMRWSKFCMDPKSYQVRCCHWSSCGWGYPK